MEQIESRHDIITLQIRNSKWAGPPHHTTTNNNYDYAKYMWQ